MHNHSAPAASTLKLPFYRQLYFQVVFAIVLGVLLGHRDRLPVWLAGGVGTLALLAPLQGGAALWPTLLQAGMLAGLTLFLGQVALRLRQQTEALGHGPRRLAALARDIATGADLGAHADTGAYAPGSLAHALADTACGSPIAMRSATSRFAYAVGDKPDQRRKARANTLSDS